MHYLSCSIQFKKNENSYKNLGKKKILFQFQVATLETWQIIKEIKTKNTKNHFNFF